MSDDIPVLSTRVARADYADNDFRGHRLNAELLGVERMASMTALAVGGPRLSGEDLAILEDLAVAVTVADPRIWPLKVTRVVGAYGSKFAAFAAGSLVMDGALMSVEICCETARRLAALAPIAQTLDDAALAAHLDEAWPERRPPGFGVPGREADERVVGLRGRMRAEGRQPRPFFLLFERVAELMRARRGLEANLTLIFGAIGLDLGFLPDKIGSLAWATAQTAFLANAVEGAEQAPEALRRLPKSSLRYVGRAARTSPRAGGDG